MAKKQCKDHLGNVYSSVKDMCRLYGISYATYSDRINKGYTLKEALTNPCEWKHVCKDHLGNVYDSLASMCKSYGISKDIYLQRIKLGWSLEEALTIPSRERRKVFVDHLGNKYNTLSDMLKQYDVSPSAYYLGIRKGWELKRILTQHCVVAPRQTELIDHLGNSFSSPKKMCEFYNISYGLYWKRKTAGWSLKDILTTPSDKTNKHGQQWTYKNKTYNTLKALCREFNISLSTFHRRQKQGLSLEEILESTYADMHGTACEDHLGNKFSNFKALCKYHHISYSLYMRRISENWTIEEAITIPRNMYIGEYRVAECLKRLHVKFYHDCTVKTVFNELKVNINWNEFLNSLQQNLAQSGCNWSKQKISCLRPDFVLFEDEKGITGVIEFDGEQHQNFVEHFFKTIEEFVRRSNSDFVKQSLWEYLNIPMLRIRDDQIDKIDDMVQDFIARPEYYITNHNTYLSEEEYWAHLRNTMQKLNIATA